MKGVECMMCHRAIESADFGNFPRSAQPQGPLRKSERPGPTANPPPLALSTARDRKLIGIQTGTVPDCGPQPSRTAPHLGWSEIAVKPSGMGGGRAAPQPDF